MASTTVSIPIVNREGVRPLVGRHAKIEVEEIKEDITSLIEGIGGEKLSDKLQNRLRSYIYAHYHPELRIGARVRIYQAVKGVLEDENLSELKGIAGIKERSAYINTISNVGKRSSYFGGLIGVSVAGYFFLPPIVKFGVIPVARSAIRNLVPKQIQLTPIDKPLKLSSLVGKSSSAIYSGLRAAMGPDIRKAGKPVSKDIDTSPMDDLVGNLFFRSLIEHSSFDEGVKSDFRERAQIAFLYDMARVSRPLEGLALTPDQCWARISNYTNFGMFLKSMESKEVPIEKMLRGAVDTISRGDIGSGKKDLRFYIEFERGLKHLNYILQVVEPLDKFNEKDDFDDLDSTDAKLAFFRQNRIVMERLYFGHDAELAKLKPMFLDLQKAALEPLPRKEIPEVEKYKVFQSKISGIIKSYRKAFTELGKAELKIYREELNRLRGR